jgi:hypothetical protein
MRPIFFRIGHQGETQILTRFKVHPQLNDNGHPVDGALVGAGSLCPGPVGLGWVGLG